MRHKTMQAKLLLLLASFSLPDHQAYAEGMADYAAAARNDMSLNLLKTIVGNVTGVFEGGDNSPLGAMFMVLSVAIASVAVLFAGYGMIAAILDAAKRGEVFSASRYDKFWLPVKMGTGIGMLMPAFGGWSGAQIVMLWAAVWGIGIGNMVWQAGAHAMLTYVAPQQILAPGTSAFNHEVINGLLMAQVCARGHNDQVRQNGQSASLGVMEPIPAQSSEIFQISYGGGPTFPDTACGGIRFSTSPLDRVLNMASNPLTASFNPVNQPPYTRDAILQAHREAIIQLDTALRPISERLYRDRTPPDPATITDLAQNYRQQVASSLTSAATRGAEAFGQYMQTEGRTWFTAGIIFMKIAGINKQIQDAADLQPTVIRPSAGLFTPSLTPGATEAMNTLQTVMNESEEAEGGADGLINRMMHSMSSPLLDATLAFIAGTDSDLLASTMAFGRRITALAATGWIGGTMAMGLVEKASSLTGAFPWPVGAISRAIIELPPSVVTNVSMMMLAVFVPLIGVGLLYGFYVPLLPFIIWIGALLSWLVTVIEAILAAPLWCLAHLHAEGEGMGSQTTHGYLFLLHLIFRPAFMIFGLVCGWAALKVMGVVLRYSLSIVYGSGGLGMTGLAGIIGFIAILATFGIISMMLVNRSFALIHTMPDAVFTWIGARITGTGGRESEHIQPAMVATGAFMGKEGHAHGGRQVRQIEGNLRDQQRLEGGSSTPGNTLTRRE